MRASEVIRELSEANVDRCVVVADHDITALDYACDFISILYGQTGAFGIVNFPQDVKEGINTFLEGFIKSENVRFRDAPFVF